MTLRDASGTTNDYVQNFNVENELSSVVNNGSTTTFTYDAAGIRVKTIEPGGTTHYYPFPGYEEEVNGATTTRHTTYGLAGQTVALRVRVVGGSNTLYYQHSDHLGSTVLAVARSSGGWGWLPLSFVASPFWRKRPKMTTTNGERNEWTADDRKRVCGRGRPLYLTNSGDAAELAEMMPAAGRRGASPYERKTCPEQVSLKGDKDV